MPHLIRKARLIDTAKISQILRGYSAQGVLLGRNEPEVSERIREFAVYELDEKIVGVISLAFFWEKLAEIRSLAIDEEYQRRGIGKKMVDYVTNEAKEYGCKTLFTLTYEQVFFEKLGFEVTDKHNFSQKVWVECTRCPKFPDCDEIAMSKSL